ncbi:PEP-utilizing enzyme [Nocardia sp. XZ_19_369]|uniref:PEP-utilizing enzyme n=1 Tax=Nocardia sp. XZ_19_369 TaxID=2769487 RepID=UPI001890122C|nr:PEP-utilizing enzyme [Nocardia sp. XZ_19_369]
MCELEWSRSSVSMPMSELEYDLLAVGYATGFGRALTGFLNHGVAVRITRRSGHLYSALESANAPVVPALSLSEAENSWPETVSTTMQRHFVEFGDLLDNDPHFALVRARELFADCIALHHALMLPARQQLRDVVALVAGIDGADRQTDSTLTALEASMHVGSAIFDAAAALLDAEPEILDDAGIITTIAAGACDGDGYGLAQPGWLEDARYGRRIVGLLQTFDVTPEVLRRRRIAAEARQSAAAAELRYAVSADIRGGLDERLDAARAASQMAETHGPLMHVRYTHELRRLTTVHGVALTRANRLDHLDDIFHLTLSELSGDREVSKIVEARRATYCEQSCQCLPPQTFRSHGCAALPITVTARLRHLGTPPGRPTGTRQWRGIGAARGKGEGPLRVLRTQADIARLVPGDIALVPDAGPAWGWLALAGIPLIVEQGGLLGHAPAVAREVGSCCVVGAQGLATLVTDGEVVKVSGDTGEVTW